MGNRALQFLSVESLVAAVWRLLFLLQELAIYPIDRSFDAAELTFTLSDEAVGNTARQAQLRKRGVWVGGRGARQASSHSDRLNPGVSVQTFCCPATARHPIFPLPREVSSVLPRRLPNTSASCPVSRFFEILISRDGKVEKSRRVTRRRTGAARRPEHKP